MDRYIGTYASKIKFVFCATQGRSLTKMGIRQDINHFSVCVYSNVNITRHFTQKSIYPSVCDYRNLQIAQ